MFQQLVVPVDGSAVSWHAVPVPARLAAAVDGKLEDVVELLTNVPGEELTEVRVKAEVMG